MCTNHHSALLCDCTQENVSPNKRSQNQFQSCSITEWSSENVCHWLIALEMEKYTPVFTDKNVTGSQLLLLDSSKLKVWAIWGLVGWCVHGGLGGGEVLRLVQVEWCGTGRVV